MKPSKVLVLTAVVGCLLVLTSAVSVAVLSTGLASADNAVTALTVKSAEQTKAETQLRALVISQQTTIARQRGALDNEHDQTIVAVDDAFASVERTLRPIAANLDAIDLVVVDALDGNKAALDRDLRLLLAEEPPLP